MLGINMWVPPFGLMLWKRPGRFALGLESAAFVLPGGFGEPVRAMRLVRRCDPPRDRLPQPNGGTVHGDERVGVGVPYRHQAKAPQPHVHLARHARRTVAVARKSAESNADPPSADVIGDWPHARLGVMPKLG